MNDISSFWHWYIAILSIISIIGCGVLLKMQSTKRLPPGEKADLHGHIWDGDLQEYNNPLPRWWMWMFYITIIFSLAYLVFYPGLGNMAGYFGWTSKGEYEAELKQAEAQYGPLYEQYAKTDIVSLAKDPQANAMGLRLFLNECAQCHGSDAGGARGFPNLRDTDWLYGGDPQTIKATIQHGRNGVMPPLGEGAGGEVGIIQLTQYVRALAGLSHDKGAAELGRAKFAVCAACHGTEGKGNPAVGAPNLTDKIWLYGSDAETIAEGIRNGRNNQMPAQLARLGDAKVHLMAAYVYSLGGGTPPDAQASAARITASP